MPSFSSRIFAHVRHEYSVDEFGSLHRTFSSDVFALSPYTLLLLVLELRVFHNHSEEWRAPNHVFLSSAARQPVMMSLPNSAHMAKINIS